MSLRADQTVIVALIARDTRVLDIGCGDGALLAELRATAQIDGRGIELDARDVASAVGRGLSVVQGDADTDLADYPADAFDVVILSNTLQAMHAPATVLGQMLRIGRRAVVSFPNFGHWRVRLALLFGGRMPVTPTLPISWHETPNIHLCTIDDFRATVAEHGFRIESAAFLSGGKRCGASLANLRAEQAVFVLRRA